MTHTPRPLALRSLLLAAILLTFTACTGAQRVADRPVGPPPFGPDLRPQGIDARDDNPWQRWAVASDTSGAEAAFSLAFDGAPDALSRFGRAEVRLHQASFEDGFADHLALLRTTPEDPLARWSAIRLWQLRDVVPTWSEDVAGVLSALEGKQLDPATRGYLGFLALHVAYARSRQTGTPTVFDGAPLGFAQPWTLIEPLTVFPYEGWDRALDPIGDDPVLAEQVKLAGYTRKVRPVVFDGPGGTVQFQFTGAHLLESWMSLEADTEVVAQLYTESRAEVKLDDTVLFARPPLSGVTQRRFGEVMTLGKGAHRLRVKVGTTTGSESFTLLLTPTDGRPLAATFTARPASASPTLGTLTRAAAAPTATFFPDLDLDGAYGHPILLWLLAVASQEVGDLATARDALTQLQDRTPRFPMLPMTWARVAQEDAEAAPQTRLERALGFYREAANLDPAALAARLELATLLSDLGQTDESLTLLDALEQERPTSFIVDWTRFQHYRDKGWTAQAQEALRQAMAVNPSDCRLVNAQWEQWERLQNKPAEEDLPPEFFGCDTTWEQLARTYDVPRGAFDKALSRFDVLAARNPGLIAYQLQRATLLRRLGRSEEAQRLYDAIAAVSNDPSEIRLQQTDALVADGKTKEAERLLTRLLSTAPGDYSLRRRLDELQRSPVLAELRVDGDAIIRRYLEHPLGEDASAAYVLDYAGTRVYEDGASLTVTHNIIRVNNKDGIDQFGEVEIPGNALLLMVRTLKPDGRGLEPEFIEGKPTISMPNLEPGDFIEYAYLQGEDAGLLRRDSYRGFRFYFNIFDAPLLHSEYVIELPASFEPVIDVRNGAPTPTVTERDGFKRYRFLVEEGPRASAEPNAVAGAEFLPSIRVGHHTALVDYQRAWRDQMLANTEPTDRLRRIVASIRAAVARAGEVSQLRLAHVLYDVVIATLTDDDSGLFAQPAAYVVTATSGDRLIVLKTLYDIAGIDNEVVIARTFGSDPTDSSVPEIESYTLAVLHARVDGEDLWLDPTNNHTLFRYINPIIQGADGLTLAAVDGSGAEADKALHVTVPRLDPGTDQHDVDLRIVIDANGDATGTATESFLGADAALYRRIFDRYTDRDKLRQDFAQGIAESFPGARIDTFEIKNQKNPGAPLSITYTFVSPGLARVDGKSLVLDRVQLPASLSSTWATLPERKLAMNILEAMHITFSMRYTFPEGYAATSLIQTVNTQTPFGSYRQDTFEVGGGNTVRCKRTVVLPIQRVAPEDYPAFRSFAQEVDQADRIHLKATPR